MKMKMKKKTTLSALALMAGAALLLGSVQSQAAEPAENAVKSQAKNKTTKSKPTKRGNAAKFVPGSQETSKDRDMRLKRECKGAVNAGACAGYAAS